MELILFADETGIHDPTGKQPGSSVAGVCGFLAWEEQWDRLKMQWRSVLERYDVPAFHSAEFHSGHGPYADWPPIRKESFILELIDVALDNTLLAVGGFISTRGYHQHAPKRLKDELQHPYHFCLQLLIDNVLKYVEDFEPPMPTNQQVSFRFEQQDDFQNGGEARFARIKELRDVKDRLGTIRFVTKIEAPELQAADLLGYRQRKVLDHMLASGQGPSLGTWDQAFNRKRNLVIGYYDSENLVEIIRTWEKGNRPPTPTIRCSS